MKQLLLFSAFFWSSLGFAFGESSMARSQVTIRSQTFLVDVVRTPSEWARGLMYRERLAPHEGMLFFGKIQKPQSFWMKNTLVPLDIIYIDRSWRIVSIAKNAEPLSETPLPSLKPAMHVLEILGGRADALGIRPGDRVQFKEKP